MLDCAASIFSPPKHTHTPMHRPPTLQWPAWKLVPLAPGVTFPTTTSRFWTHTSHHILDAPTEATETRPLIKIQTWMHASMQVYTNTSKYDTHTDARTHTNGHRCSSNVKQAGEKKKRVSAVDFNEHRSQTAVNSHANL